MTCPPLLALACVGLVAVPALAIEAAGQLLTCLAVNAGPAVVTSENRARGVAIVLSPESPFVLTCKRVAQSTGRGPGRRYQQDRQL
jgi:hypothetical protein